MAPHCVEEVHLGEHFRVSLILEGAPLLMGRLRQVRDTLQVCRQALAEISLSSIVKSVNAPKYQVPIHCNIVHKYHCDPPYPPTLTKDMQATIDEPSMPRSTK